MEITVQLKAYVAAVVRLWWLVALIAISATAGSYFYTKLQPPLYRSTLLLISPAQVDWGATMSVQVNLRQQEQRLKTVDFASRVNERMQLNLSPGEIAGKVRTASYPDSITIRVDVEDRDPGRAQRIALGYGQVLEEDRAWAAANARPESLDHIMVTMLEEPGPAAQIGPNVRANTAAGAVLGMMLGLVLVLLLSYFDSTIRTPEDVERHLGMATIGLIPDTDRSRR
jgi:capsular polysaccharide biosynthesis protein